MHQLRKKSGLHPWAPLGAVFLLFALAAPAAFADGTEELGAPGIPISSGSGFVAAGVGLSALGDGQPGTISVDVPGAVQQALLYWEGANEDAADYTATMEITVDPNGAGAVAVTGVAIGGNTQYSGGFVTVSYRADITSLVDPGANLLVIDGLDFTQVNDGAGVLVIFDDGSISEIEIRDGSDYAFRSDIPGDSLRGTVPQEFLFASSEVERTAALSLFFGAVAGTVSGAGDERPNTIEVTVAGTTTELVNLLNSVDGEEWDTVNLDVTIPAGATSLTVQAFSDDRANTGNLPASLVWVTAGLAIEFEEGEGCFNRTAGFWCNRPLATDFVLPIEVCGITLLNVDAMTQGSAIEDLVFGNDHTIDNGRRGVDPAVLGYPNGIAPQNLQLVRQCTAAQLNLAVTEVAEGDCNSEIPGIVERINACCTLEQCTASADTIDASGCIEDLDDFNNEDFGSNELGIPDTFPSSNGTGLAGYFPPGAADSSTCSEANGNGFINMR
jgi:hypothetical protein